MMAESRNSKAVVARQWEDKRIYMDTIFHQYESEARRNSVGRAMVFHLIRLEVI
jgi:hypothetical protein